jgi:hypothetical protein
MIVTIGGISVRLTFVDDGTPKSINDIGAGLPDRISRFTGRKNRACLTITVTTAVGPCWDAILTPEDFARMQHIARRIEGRFPFTGLSLRGPNTRKIPTETGHVSFPLLAAFDTGHVSVVPHSGFLVATDHRLGRADALVRIEEDSDWESSLAPVLQAVMALCAPDYGALMLHAASLTLDGDGYLFVGNSGAGKTTIAGSVEPGLVFSDDGSWCSQDDGTFSLYPTPFSQVDITRTMAPAPLKRVLFLEKGTQDRIADLSPGRAMTMLLSNHIHFFRFMGREPAARAFGLAGEICRKHPVSTLVFTRDFDPHHFFRGIADEAKKAV